MQPKGDVTREDDTLGLLQEEAVEVVNNEGVGVAGGVGDGGEEHSLARVSGGNCCRVKSCQGIVPKVEESPNSGLVEGLACGGGGLCLRNGEQHCNAKKYKMSHFF